MNIYPITTKTVNCFLNNFNEIFRSLLPYFDDGRHIKFYIGCCEIYGSLLKTNIKVGFDYLFNDFDGNKFTVIAIGWADTTGNKEIVFVRADNFHVICVPLDRLDFIQKSTSACPMDTIAICHGIITMMQSFHKLDSHPIEYSKLI